MNAPVSHILPPHLASELERKYFWWEPAGNEPRSDARILAQVMEFASFDDVLRLEKEVGVDRLVDVMLDAAPGWLSDRSWEFWRGRLSFATGRAIPDEPARRAFL